MLKPLLSLITILFISSFANAASGSGAPHIDWTFIYRQLANFLVFGGLIFYFGRKFLPGLMVDFKEDYLAKASAAKARFEEARRTKEDLEKKLRDLELNYDETLKKAKVEAEELRISKITKAEAQASSMDKDLSEQITALKRSYWLEVKTGLINQAVDELKNEFSDKVDPAVLQKLQDDFVSKISTRVS